MNHFHHPDGERHQTASLSQAEKADGFAEVMERLKNSSGPERGRLRAQADAAILGHEAYSLGYDNFRRGNHVAAMRWLRVAADHSVPGAAQALEEIEAGSTVPELPEPLPVEIVVDAAPCTSDASWPVSDEFAGLSSVLEAWAKASLTMDIARAEARQMTEQAREDAEKLIAETRQDVERARADAWEDITAWHRWVAELLREVEELQQEARLLLQKARREAEEATGKGQLFEDLLGDAVMQPAQARSIGHRGHGSIPDGEQQPMSARLKTFTVVRTLTAPADAETGMPLTLAMAPCLDGPRQGTWHTMAQVLFEAYRRAVDETAERITDRLGDVSGSAHFPVLVTNSHAVLSKWLQRMPLRMNADWRLEGSRALYFSDGSMRLAIAPWNFQAETGFTCSLFRESTDRIVTGNEGVSTTPEPERQRGAVRLEIYRMAECYVEADESRTAEDVVDIHEPAPVTPR
ncbi:hypothetical protein [Streptomyces chartreusis]|uniref:hypothetical protein n=1 Tax=Streptomyces chartreusis TaxID=1969 RepID=UPI0036623DF0